ncbi:MAG: VWA domain-containing protein [Thermoproteus sp. AZ2]|uniref:VWA domain-containing protein n=1 Tax=Thermoproteus sp. AZ2 TaxID=1609232 RepID=A0ACC6V415_9CREN|nr:MAG: hypothetical protein TU35_01110 [Thermoproteus sp. AZ2]
MLSTSRNFARKLALRRPLSDSDIVLREYRKSRGGGFAICLDVSGSMKEYVGNATKLQIALGSIARYIDRLRGEDAELSLILFNAEADILWAPYSVAAYGEYMKALLPYVFPAGGTDLAAALKLVAEEDLGGEILIISDGRTADPDAALEHAGRVRGRIHAFTMEDSPVLKRITALRGGAYRILTGYPQ